MRLLSRLFGRTHAKEMKECEQKEEETRAKADEELRRRHAEYLTRMEDEIAAVIRQRENGH